MTKTKINYRIKKIKNIKREYDNTFWKKVVALAMKILLKKKIVQMVGKVLEKQNPNNTELIELFKNGANYVSEENIKPMLEKIK